MSLASPYPYFGGKATVAPLIWQAFGDIVNYAEPMFGSGAVLLARPNVSGIETVNDADAHIPNFWRALQHEPEKLASLMDYPVHEVEQHAWHLWLIGPARRQAFVEHMLADPDYYDILRAARWCHGLCCWIGSGWCSGKGPWSVEDGQLVHLGDAGQGIHRQRVHLGDAGREETFLGYIQALAARLRFVRVCCGDWTRVLGSSVTTKHGVTGVLLDPPYAHAERDAGLYTVDTDISGAVRDWALAHGDDPCLRIVLCGYASEHAMPATWQAVEWKTRGGAGQSGQGQRARECRPRTTLVFAAVPARDAAIGAVWRGGIVPMWHLWRFRPRPLCRPSHWPWQYYAWRLETYAGIPASEVRGRTFLMFFRQPQHRRAFWRYVRWLGQMRRLRESSAH